MSGPNDRIVELEARIAELERRAGDRRNRPMRRMTARLAVIGLALALVIPAGVVLAGSQRFSDVSPSNPFFDDIEALAASGVTGGCTTTAYCPKSTVTREQMAAFLNRLGALEAEKAPVVNADRLDGRHANELTRVASANTGATIVLSTTAATYLQAQITAPTDGYLLATATVTFENHPTLPCQDGYICLGQVQLRVGSALSGMASGVVQDGGSRKTNVGVTSVFPVAAGSRVVEVRVSEPYTDTDWDVQTDAAQLTVLFVPFNASGG